MPLFSIIIPTYDRPEFLAEALASVQAQTFCDFECIVVDDGSPTDVHLPTDERFRLVRRNTNGGPAAAVNTGVHEARGRYLIRMDDDDLLAPDRLVIAREGLERAAVALCWARFIDEEPSPKRQLDGDVGHVILDETTPHMGTAAVAREFFLDLDERYHGAEDVEWWLRVTARTTVATVPRFGYLVRQHSGPRIMHGLEARVSGSRRMLEEHADYFRQHPRAEAFRLKRIGLMEIQLGNRTAGRRALLESVRLHPTLRSVKHFMLTFPRLGGH